MARNKQEEQQPPKKLKDYLVPAVSLLLVIAAMVVLFIYREHVVALGNWGYLGAFLIGFVGNVTVILPMPGLLLLFGLGATFNPFLVGLAGAAGGAIGEIGGYAVGYSGGKFIGNNRMFKLAQDWMKKWGSLAIFLFALVPVLPLDVAAIAAGMVRFKIWKFLVAGFLGKAILYVVLTWGASLGWDLVERFIH